MLSSLLASSLLVLSAGLVTAQDCDELQSISYCANQDTLTTVTTTLTSVAVERTTVNTITITAVTGTDITTYVPTLRYAKGMN